MRTDLTRCSVTVVGAWNLAIFTPPWVSAKLLVPTVHASMGFLPMGAFVQFEMPEVALIVVPGQFQVRPQRDDRSCWDAAEAMARKILKILPETPINAFGVNVGLDLDDSPELSAVLDLRDLDVLKALGGSTEVVAVHRRVQLDGHTCNVNVSRQGEVIRFDVNHHFDSASAAAAEAALDGCVARSRALSSRVAKACYGSKDLAS